MLPRRLVKGLDEGRLRNFLLLFFVALAVPTAVLIGQAYSQLKWEAFHQYRGVAEELARRVDTRLDDEGLFHALRCLLPADLRAVALRTVSSAFNSRRDAVSKTYRYRLDLSAHGDPFLARYALHRVGPLDPE